VSIQIRIGNAGKNGGNRAREEWKAAGVERGKTYERGRVAGAARDFFILVSLKNRNKPDGNLFSKSAS
jgi:hypothetical protein